MATGVFVGLVVLFGGFSGNDVFESAPSAWAIQHGQITCAFPKGFKVTAPLYPLLSGGLARLAGLGHTMPFPPRSAMGPDCDRAFVVINAWSSQARVVGTTLKFAYGGWIVLMAGAIAALRAAGRGLRGWEPATLILLACLPTVWTCVESTFHPEDLMAVGFALAAVACALRGSWIGAGALIGLAVLSQQFAILVAVPLLIVAPARERVGYGATAAFTFALVALPLVLASSSSAAHSIFLGTGDTGGIGGSLLWELGLQGTPLLALSRIVPVLLSVPLAWWAVRRLGRRRALQPVALLSLVAVALCLRLIFEQQIFEYYYMGLSVVLVLLDVARGHIRGSLVAWLIAVPTVFIEEIAVPESLEHLVPVVAIIISVLVIGTRALRGGHPGQFLPWIGVIVAALLTWDTTAVLGTPPDWFWQVALVVPVIVLAARPLLAEARNPDARSSSRASRTPARVS